MAQNKYWNYACSPEDGSEGAGNHAEEQRVAIGICDRMEERMIGSEDLRYLLFRDRADFHNYGRCGRGCDRALFVGLNALRCL